MALSELPRLITTLEDLKRLVDRVYASGTAYAFDFETLGTRIARLKPVGFGLAWGPGENDGAYVVTLHDSEPFIPWEQALAVVKPLFEDESMTMISHNSLFDVTILDYHGVHLHTNTFDTLVLAWMLNTETPNGLKGLVERRYAVQMTELTEFVDKGIMAWHPGKVLRVDQAPVDKLTAYGVDDVRWTYKLWMDAMEFMGRGEPALLKVYKELYQELLLVLAGMMSDGVRLDVDFLREREAVIRQEVAALIVDIIGTRRGQDFDGSICENWSAADIDSNRRLIPELAAKWTDRNNLRPLLYEHPTLAHKLFNLNSAPQLNAILFGENELGLVPLGERGKSGHYSVDAEVMAKLVGQDSTGFVAKLQRYKMLVKLLETYYAGLQELVDDDGRVRTRFNPALKTGRLSSAEPNLQNIPGRTDEGKEIRKAFVPREGFTMVCADYSQAELRILAELSEDQVMVDGFNAGVDPHSVTAKAAFSLDCEPQEVKEQHATLRRAAKVLNFGIIYGLGAEGIANNIAKETNGELRLSTPQAQALRETVLSNMPGVGKWMRSVERMAQQLGFVTTIIGRKRHLPDAQQNADRGKYFGALRRAVNSPIQGSASDIIHIAMRNMRRRFVETDDWRTNVFLVLQVHDELLFEVRTELVDTVVAVIKREMENAVSLRVPMVAEPGVGGNWLDAKA